jgi:hypothetical protein
MGANPVWTPPPPVSPTPVMLVRAARGPVLLMILGTLFAIDHFGPYPFERTWPVLFIVLGVWKLLEHVLGRSATPPYVAPPYPPPTPPPPPGGPAHA